MTDKAKMGKATLYMMALVPPTDLKMKIERIRYGFAEAYNCKAALKPPVHITLHPPYTEVEAHERKVIEQLTGWCSRQVPFDVILTGFAAFKQNGVIFINVEKSDSLKELHRGFAIQMNRLLQSQLKRTQNFHPHITIGYRDIPKEHFQDAIKDYLPRKFEGLFRVDKIEFWKHNGTRWTTLHSFPFQKETASIRQVTLF